jgi:hypothetical protein
MCVQLTTELQNTWSQNQEKQANKQLESKDFYTPLSVINQIGKRRWRYRDIDIIVKQLDLINVYRIFNPIIIEYELFSNKYETFAKTRLCFGPLNKPQQI